MKKGVVICNVCKTNVVTDTKHTNACQKCLDKILKEIGIRR
jgi:hypothetical protein